MTDLDRQYELRERISIKMDSGIPEAEAERQAMAEQPRERPARALSVQQPWAWLIAHGLKDIENRDWATSFRGRIMLHAGKKMDRAAYEDLVLEGHKLPALDDLPCGGFVGEVEIYGCVKESKSRWFCGVYGFQLRDAVAYEAMIPARGKLGFFVPEQSEA